MSNHLFKKQNLISALNALPDVFQLMPQTNYLSIVPRKSAKQRMNHAWKTTGNQIRNALILSQECYSLPSLDEQVHNVMINRRQAIRQKRMINKRLSVSQRQAINRRKKID